MIRDIFKTILLLCALLCFIFAISSCGEEPRSTHPERQNIDTIPFATIDEIRAIVNGSQPAALRVAPGRDWTLDNVDSLAEHGAMLISQNPDNGRQSRFYLSTLLAITRDSLSGYADTLRLSNDTLYISGQNYVLLSDYLDNTDAQTLSFSNPNLSILGGNSVDLSALMGGASTLLNYQNNLGEIYLLQEEGTLTGDTLADIISGVLYPIQYNAKQSDTVTIPSDFTYDPGVKIVRKGDTFATCIDDLQAFRDSFFLGGKSYYVDPITGDDSNTGLSASDAFKTYEFARTRSDVAAIYLKGAIYDSISTFLTNKTNYALIGYGGTPILGKIENQKTWTSVGNGVWKTVVTDTLSWAIDLLTYGQLGEPVRFKHSGNEAGLSKPGTYYYKIGTSDTLLIHTSDGNSPDNYRNAVIVDGGAIAFGTSTNFYFENVMFLGSLSLSNASSNYYFRDCGIFYGVSTNLILASNSNVVLSNVTAGHSKVDVLNYTSGSTVLEHNVRARYAGYDASGSDNQISTGHLASEIITINCDYAMSSNQVIFDVNADTKRLILGGVFGGAYNKEVGTTGAISAGNASGDFAEIWIDRAKIGGDFGYDLLVNYGTINLKNMNINNNTRASVANGGTIQLY